MMFLLGFEMFGGSAIGLLAGFALAWLAFQALWKGVLWLGR